MNATNTKNAGKINRIDVVLGGLKTVSANRIKETLCFEKGSTWRRWDLHLHAPGTKLANQYGDSTAENLRKYVDFLEDSDVQAFGITDYFSFDSYCKVKTAYDKAYPDGKKLIIPNIEFRLTETISSAGSNIHTHVLIDPKVAASDKLNTFTSDLVTHITQDSGEIVRCKDLKSIADFEQATVGLKDLKDALARVFPDETTYMIVTAANNDGLRGVDNQSPRSISISEELDKASHGFFGSSKNTSYFLNEKRYSNDVKARKKPVYSGSDAHSFDDLDRLSGDEQGFEATWIKADLTFRGLRQTFFEPGRVHIGERPAVLDRLERDSTRFITKLDINQVSGYNEANGSWFNNVTIPLNPELTVIIGNKGSGKSALADIFGLIGDSRQYRHFSFLTNNRNNRKFKSRGYAENFKASVTWASGETTDKNLDAEIDEFKPEKVKYLPQNYFESLTNEIEVEAFRNEIEKVVFSHVDESDRMGKSSFSELEGLKTHQSRTNISTLKAQLRELNYEIVELEEQANPDTKASLEEELVQRKKEYEALIKSKPEVVKQPQIETDEQREITKQIEEIQMLISEVTSRGKQAVEKQSLLKSTLGDLCGLKDSLISLNSSFINKKEEFRLVCNSLGLDIDSIVSVNTNMSSIDEKISATQAALTSLEFDDENNITEKTNFNAVSNIPNLKKSYTFLKNKLAKLRESLSAPQKRYQRYVQALSEVADKMSNLMGEEQNPKPGTIKFVEERIKYIEKEAQIKLKEKHKERDKISRSIFKEKKKVRQFYEGLKTSIENKLESIHTVENGKLIFDVSIDASFVSSHEFSNEFFGFLNQSASGPFRGAEPGLRELDSRTSEVDWNDVESVLNFVKEVIEEIKAADVKKQVKDVKGFYDFLFSFEYFSAHYELRLSGKNLNQLSPGEKGLLLLVFYLFLDMEKTPLIIDQPEDNLDNESIFDVLAHCIRQAKKTRQVILVTHNPNLAIGADAEQVIYVSLDKANNFKFAYNSGSIERPRINDQIIKILEGSRPAFVKRRLAYQIK